MGRSCGQNETALLAGESRALWFASMVEKAPTERKREICASAGEAQYATRFGNGSAEPPAENKVWLADARGLRTWHVLKRE